MPSIGQDPPRSKPAVGSSSNSNVNGMTITATSLPPESPSLRTPGTSYFDKYPERRAKGPYLVSEKLTQPLLSPNKRKESRENAGERRTTGQSGQGERHKEGSRAAAPSATSPQAAGSTALVGLGITSSQGSGSGSSTFPLANSLASGPARSSATTPISRTASSTTSNDAELYAALRRDLGIGSSAARVRANGPRLSSDAAGSRHAASASLAPTTDTSPDASQSQWSSSLPPKAALTYPRSPARSYSSTTLKQRSGATMDGEPPLQTSRSPARRSESTSYSVPTSEERMSRTATAVNHSFVPVFLHDARDASSAGTPSGAGAVQSTQLPKGTSRTSISKESVPSIDDIIRRSASKIGLASAMGIGVASVGRAEGQEEARGNTMSSNRAAASPASSRRSSNDRVDSNDSSMQSMYTAWSSLNGRQTPSVRSGRLASSRASIEPAYTDVTVLEQSVPSSVTEHGDTSNAGSSSNRPGKSYNGAPTPRELVSVSSSTSRTSFGSGASTSTTSLASLAIPRSTGPADSRPTTSGSTSTVISEEDLDESDALSISSVDSIEQEIRASLRVSKTRERALKAAESARRKELEAIEKAAKADDERRAAYYKAASAPPRKELHHAVSFPSRPGKAAPNMRSTISSPGRRRTASSASSTSSIRKSVVESVGISTPPLPNPERLSISSASPSSEEASALARFLRSARLTRLVQLQRGPYAGCTASMADVGCPTGHPVMVFLGLGAVRYLVALYDEMATALGLRLICIDRWGMGRTDDVPDERRSVLGWADVVIEVADRLGVGRFSVLAHSAGAPYAMGTVLAYPDRIAGPAHLLAPWVSSTLESGYKWLKYVPDGVIRTAQAAEWRMQGWRLGKMPSLAYEGVGSNALDTSSSANVRLGLPPSPGHTSRSSLSPSPTPDTAESRSPLTSSLSLHSSSSRGPSPLPSLSSPPTPQFQRTSPTIGSENLSDVSPTWPTKLQDVRSAHSSHTSVSTNGGVARGSAESYISVPSVQPDGTRTPTLMNGERGISEFGAFLDRDPASPKTPGTPGKRTLKTKTSFLNGILRSRSSNGSNLRAAAHAAAAKGDLPPLPDAAGVDAYPRRPSSSSVDTKRAFGSLGRNAGNPNAPLIRASSDSRRSSLDPRPSLSAEIGLAERYLAGRPSDSWEEEVRTELAHAGGGADSRSSAPQTTPVAAASWGSKPSLRSFNSSSVSLASNISTGAYLSSGGLNGSGGLTPPITRSFSSRTDSSSSPKSPSLGEGGGRDKETPPLPIVKSASADTPTRASSLFSSRSTRKKTQSDFAPSSPTPPSGVPRDDGHGSGAGSLRSRRSRTTTVATTASSSAASSTSNLSLLPASGAQQSAGQGGGFSSGAAPLDLATALLRASHAESLRGGAADLLCILGRSSAQPWGFTFKDIRSGVKVWHGDRDERISLSGARWMEKEMQRCTLKVVKGAGHGLMTNVDVVVEALESIAETKD